jgi:hypothetical protein
MEDLFDEIVGSLDSAPAALESIEKSVKAKRNGTRLRRNEALYHEGRRNPQPRE